MSQKNLRYSPCSNAKSGFKEVSNCDCEDFIEKQFNASEYERLKSYYEEYIEYGGFPEIALTAKINDKKDLIADIISSYINIDVKTLADFYNQESIYKLIKMLAGRSCTRLDYSKLSRLAGISRITTQNYIEFLEKTYLIERVPVLAKNPDREIVKAKKIYFCDNGIMNILEDVSSGVKFENAIFAQLRSKGAICYYSLKTGREIDFILDKKIALEAKESPVAYDNIALKELSGALKLKKYRLVGRLTVPNFKDYVWGGDIR